jgi:hypothetical protein
VNKCLGSLTPADVYLGRAARLSSSNGIKSVALEEKTGFRGVGSVGLAITFAAAAYSRIRLPKLLAETG